MVLEMPYKGLEEKCNFWSDMTKLGRNLDKGWRHDKEEAQQKEKLIATI